jgi:hypothetical protein
MSYSTISEVEALFCNFDLRLAMIAVFGCQLCFGLVGGCGGVQLLGQHLLSAGPISIKEKPGAAPQIQASSRAVFEPDGCPIPIVGCSLPSEEFQTESGKCEGIP